MLVAELYGPWSEWTARRVLPLAKLFSRVTWDLEVTGREHIPPGAVVFAGNHQSHIDPPLVSIAVRANVRYLAVDELFGRSTAFDRLILFFGAIPMPRTRPPLGALKAAIGHLQAGGPVGVFPEGRRTAFWGEESPRRGAAWLALRTGAPLVPVAIAGTDQTLSKEVSTFRRTPIRVWLEPPLFPDAYLRDVDPLGSMMRDWHEAMDGRLSGWTTPSPSAPSP